MQSYLHSNPIATSSSQHNEALEQLKSDLAQLHSATSISDASSPLQTLHFPAVQLLLLRELSTMSTRYHELEEHLQEEHKGAGAWRGFRFLPLLEIVSVQSSLLSLLKDIIGDKEAIEFTQATALFDISIQCVQELSNIPFRFRNDVLPQILQNMHRFGQSGFQQTISNLERMDVCIDNLDQKDYVASIPSLLDEWTKFAENPSQVICLLINLKSFNSIIGSSLLQHEESFHGLVVAFFDLLSNPAKV